MFDMTLGPNGHAAQLMSESLLCFRRPPQVARDALGLNGDDMKADGNNTRWLTLSKSQFSCRSLFAFTERTHLAATRPPLPTPGSVFLDFQHYFEPLETRRVVALGDKGKLRWSGRVVLVPLSAPH